MCLTHIHYSLRIEAYSLLIEAYSLLIEAYSLLIKAYSLLTRVYSLLTRVYSFAYRMCTLHVYSTCARPDARWEEEAQEGEAMEARGSSTREVLQIRQALEY